MNVNNRVNTLIKQFQQGKVADLPAPGAPIMSEKDSADFIDFWAQRHDHFQGEDNSPTDLDPRKGAIEFSTDDNSKRTVTVEGDSDQGQLVETTSDGNWNSTSATRYTPEAVEVLNLTYHLDNPDRSVGTYSRYDKVNPEVNSSQPLRADWIIAER